MQVVGNKYKFANWKSIFCCHPTEATVHLGLRIDKSHVSLTLYIFNILSGLSTSALVENYAKKIKNKKSSQWYITGPPPFQKNSHKTKKKVCFCLATTDEVGQKNRNRFQLRFF